MNRCGITLSIALCVLAIPLLACNLGTAVTPQPPTATNFVPTQAQPTAELTQTASIISTPVPLASPNPLFMLRSAGTYLGGDLWTWQLTDDKSKQATHWGYNQQPIVSPDGKWIAYLSVAQAAVDYIKKNGSGQGLPPSNVWILNAQTGDALRAADQPANVPFEQLISRPTPPDWSPDGKALTWIESSGNQERLAIYNLDSKNAALIQLNLPSLCCGDVLSRSVKWGQPGIAVFSVEGTTPDNSQLIIRLYNTSGAVLSTITPGRYTVRNWITDAGRWYFAAQDDINVWYLIEPMTGQILTMSGEPELYSLSAPDGATASPNDAPNAGKIHWKLRFPNAVVQLDDISAWDGVAISADGQYIACQEGLEGAVPAVKVYADSNRVLSVPITDTIPMLAWGPVAWRVRHKP